MALPVMGVKAGFRAYRDPVTGIDSVGESLLEKGPAFGRIDPVDTRDTAVWSHFQGDAQRLNASSEMVALPLEVRWEVGLPNQGGSEYRGFGVDGSRTTPATHAGGKVFVADPDAHTVYALDAATGAVSWQYTADGPINGPPTLADGCCVFGSGDGWLYALRARDGALAWRRRLARSDLLRPHLGQLQSAWPVNASVLAAPGDNGHTVVTQAGWYPHREQVNWLYGIDLATGELRWEISNAVRNSMLLKLDSAGLVAGLDPHTGSKPDNVRPPQRLGYAEFAHSLARAAPYRRTKKHRTAMWAHAKGISAVIQSEGDWGDLQTYRTADLLDRTVYPKTPVTRTRFKATVAYHALVQCGPIALLALTEQRDAGPCHLLRSVDPVSFETKAEMELPAEASFMGLTPIEGGLIITTRDGRVMRLRGSKY
jgi:hypothetical protein